MTTPERGWVGGRREHRPASGREPQPYQPGNLEALRHGAYSPRLVDPLAERFREAAVALLGGSMPDYLDRPEWDAAIRAWSRAEATVALVQAYLDDAGLFDNDGRPRPAADLLIRAEASAAKRRDELGLTPLAAARLGRDVSAAKFDLARMWANQEDPRG